MAATDRGTPLRLSSTARLFLVVSNKTSTFTPSSRSRPTVSDRSSSSSLPQAAHGRRQASGDTVRGHRLPSSSSSSVSSSSSSPEGGLTSSVVLVGAACGSGFVLVAALIAVATFVLRRRRQRHELVMSSSSAAVVGARTGWSETGTAKCYYCCVGMFYFDDQMMDFHVGRCTNYITTNVDRLSTLCKVIFVNTRTVFSSKTD